MSTSQGPYREVYEGVHLKIESKRLKSGKCQVKFTTDGSAGTDYYGYMLVDARSTLREVVLKINDRIGQMDDPGIFHQRGLFSVGKKEMSSPEIVIYRRDTTDSPF